MSAPVVIYSNRIYSNHLFEPNALSALRLQLAEPTFYFGREQGFSKGGLITLHPFFRGSRFATTKCTSCGAYNRNQFFLWGVEARHESNQHGRQTFEALHFR
jgi:hypothetical protein